MKFTEAQLKNYSAPLSTTEEERCKNAIKMIRDAMKVIGYTTNNRDIYEFESNTFAYAQDMFSPKGSKVVLLVQGSYANNTNVRTHSDVDVAVILESTFIPKYRENISGQNYNFSEGSFTVSGLKDDVEKALKQKFNYQGVERGDKSIRVHGNSYRVDSDVVPAYRYRDYSNDYIMNSENYVGGIEIRPDSGGKIINYPEQHIRRGREKNVKTNYAYKKHVRIIKTMRKLMKEQGYQIPKSVSSFGLESLLWNIPETVYSKYSSILRYTFDELLLYLKDDINNLQNYKEANGIKPLVTDGVQKEDYKSFIMSLEKFYEYDVTES